MSLPASEMVGERERFQFQCFYHPSVHAVIDLHGRMDEVEASVNASGHYPQQERRHKEHKTHNHLQIRGNQLRGRRLSVKSEGGQRWRRPPNPIFSLCPCVTGRNRWAWACEKTDLWSSVCDSFMRLGNTEIHAGQYMPPQTQWEGKHS